MSEYSDVIDLNQNPGPREYVVEKPNPFLDRVGLSCIAYLRLWKGVLTGLVLVAFAQFVGERSHISWLATSAFLVALA